MLKELVQGRTQYSYYVACGTVVPRGLVARIALEEARPGCPCQVEVASEVPLPPRIRTGVPADYPVPVRGETATPCAPFRHAKSRVTWVTLAICNVAGQSLVR